MEKEKKLFVLDTNVILHDHTCIYKFQENDIMILTTVLEELDIFKKGNDIKAFNVRNFHRELDELRKYRIKKSIGNGKNQSKKEVSAMFHGGVILGEGLGKIEIQSSPRKLNVTVKDTFIEETPDHRILSKVLELQKHEEGKRRVILVTKDVNLRLKAEALALEVEDYENDKVPDMEQLYTGKGIIENEEMVSMIDKIYESRKVLIDYKRVEKENLKPNMFFVIKSLKKSALVRADGNLESFIRVEKPTISGITPRNSEQAFAMHALLQSEIKLVSLFGKAGTGKTLLAMAAAIYLLREEKCDQIIIAAAMVPLSNRDIGALPGDANEKVSPYMQGLYDNLAFIKSQIRGKKNFISTEEQIGAKKKSQKNGGNEEEMDYISGLEREGKIKIQPLASIRGRSFNNTVFIIDETQNLTPHEVKTIVTRAGENTKVIFCGDVEQIDSPYLDARSNGLSHLVAKMSGQKLFAHVKLERGERSELAELAANLL